MPAASPRRGAQEVGCRGTRWSQAEARRRRRDTGTLGSWEPDAENSAPPPALGVQKPPVRPYHCGGHLAGATAGRCGPSCDCRTPKATSCASARDQTSWGLWSRRRARSSRWRVKGWDTAAPSSPPQSSRVPSWLAAALRGCVSACVCASARVHVDMSCSALPPAPPTPCLWRPRTRFPSRCCPVPPEGRAHGLHPPHGAPPRGFSCSFPSGRPPYAGTTSVRPSAQQPRGNRGAKPPSRPWGWSCEPVFRPRVKARERHREAVS